MEDVRHCGERVILMNMCMIQQDDGRMLVLNRRDPLWPGIAFPGGHVEPGESLVEAAIREVREETGLEVTGLKLCGIKQWYNRDKNCRCMVFLYKTDSFCGTLQASDEGEVFWIRREDLSRYTLTRSFWDDLETLETDTVSEMYFRDHGPEKNGTWEKR